MVEIQPRRRWLVLGWLAAGLWMAFVSFILVAGWSGFDWSGRTVTLFLWLLSAGFVFAIARRWRGLAIQVDGDSVRFGKRLVARADVASIAIEPPGDTPLRFWAGVGGMAISQDFSRSINLRSADGRSLLLTTDLYGREQVRRLASFLDVPLEGY